MPSNPLGQRIIATGLPDGFEIDPLWLVFGEANETGIFPVLITHTFQAVIPRPWNFNKSRKTKYFTKRRCDFLDLWFSSDRFKLMVTSDSC